MEGGKSDVGWSPQLQNRAWGLLDEIQRAGHIRWPRMTVKGGLSSGRPEVQSCIDQHSSPEHRVLKYMVIPAEMVHVGVAISEELSLVSEIQGKCSLA